jgi:hypothetical protein
MAILIAVIWAAAFVVGVITKSWAQLTIVTAPFLAVCGWVFGVAAIDSMFSKRRGPNDR